MYGKQGVLDQINKLSLHDHASLLYSNLTEQMAVIAPFIESGLALGEQCVYISEKSASEVLLNRLEKDKVNIKQVLNNGSLLLLPPSEVYLRDKKFDSERIINSISTTIDSARSLGFNTLRFSAESNWINKSYYEQMIQYEICLNDVFPKHNILAICQYAVDDFPFNFIKDMTLIHPIVIFDAFRRFYKTKI